MSEASSTPYLGDGVYFFDDQLAHAKTWAKNQAGLREKGVCVAVIASEIRYGNLLNLTDQGVCDAMQWFKNEYERKAKTPVTFATIIDIAAKLLKAEVVKACRIKGNAVLKENRFSSDIEIILAVRAIGNILSKKIVWSEMIGYT
jgi:hypothetical protein